MDLRLRALAMFLAIFVIVGNVYAQDPGERDTIRVAMVTTDAGMDVGVPVTIFNDENLGGYSMGLVWDSPDINYDSISYIGTRLVAGAFTPLQVDLPNQRILVGFADFSNVNPITPGDGLVFTIWFNVPGGTSDQFVSIDSTFIPPAGPFILSPQAGGSISPEFSIGEIKIGDPQPPPIIVLDQSSYVFNALVGGPNPPTQLQQITNGGGQSLVWDAVWNSAWLNLSPANSTAPSNIILSIDVGVLGFGTYFDTVTVSGTGATNSPQLFYVELNLTVPPPTIELVPDSFYFQVLQDSANPAAQALQINNTGMGTLNWDAVWNESWLDVSPSNGTAPSAVNLTVDNTGLIAGLYLDSVEISDPTATNSPQYAMVVFEVFSAFPVIEFNPDSIFAIGSSTEDPYDRLLTISNGGGGVMAWSIAEDASWLTLDFDTGSTVQGSPSIVTLSFDGSAESFGLHWDTLVISSPSAGNSPVLVPVTYWKAENPQGFTISTNTLVFNDVECGTYPSVGPKAFTITETQVAPDLNWTAEYSASWLTVNPASAPGNATVVVSVDGSALAAGVYKDTIIVSSDAAMNPPEAVVVTLNVAVAPGVAEIALETDSIWYAFKFDDVGTNDQLIDIWSALQGCMDWQATSTVPWITPVPDTGTGPSTFNIQSNGVGLPLGMNEGEIIITSSIASNSPQIIKLILWVWTYADANCDGMVDISDVVYIIQYIFNGGPAPCPVPWSADVDCNHMIDISDAVYIINWIFQGGPDPCEF